MRLIKKLFPDDLDRVIQRLQAAHIANQDLEEQMFAEDEYLKALIRRDNQISYMAEQLDLEKKRSEEKDKVLEENKLSLKEKDKLLEEKERLIQKLLQQQKPHKT